MMSRTDQRRGVRCFSKTTCRVRISYVGPPFKEGHQGSGKDPKASSQIRKGGLQEGGRHCNTIAE